MRPITWHVDRRGPNWLFDLLNGHPTGRRLSRWWQWAVLSLGCLAGCSTYQEAGRTAAHPLRASGELMARAGDRMEEAVAGNLSPQTRRSASSNAVTIGPKKELLAIKLSPERQLQSRPQSSSASENSIRPEATDDTVPPSAATSCAGAGAVRVTATFVAT